MVYFVSVLSFAELAPEERFALKRFILEYFYAFTATSIVFRFFSNCKQLGNLILSMEWINFEFRLMIIYCNVCRLTSSNVTGIITRLDCKQLGNLILSMEWINLEFRLMIIYCNVCRLTSSNVTDITTRLQEENNKRVIYGESFQNRKQLIQLV